ncbi:MAG: EexN family lipoprotein [Arcobacter butzleri]|nr:EexN family lipoprotein [Aliarcobacter butzleri]
MKSILILIVAMSFMVRCQTQEAKTKEYYSKNLEEAKARIAQCKKLETYNEVEQIDCGNASWALFNSSSGEESPYAKGKDVDMRKFLGSNRGKQDQF